VDEDDAPGLARALGELLDNADERRRLARAGREHAELHFDGNAAAETLQGWFQGVQRGVTA
jgi:glycosyltransferase involved in cell wall biosynthesis